MKSWTTYLFALNIGVSSIHVHPQELQSALNEEASQAKQKAAQGQQGGQDGGGGGGGSGPDLKELLQIAAQLATIAMQYELAREQQKKDEKKNQPPPPPPPTLVPLPVVLPQTPNVPVYPMNSVHNPAGKP